MHRPQHLPDLLRASFATEVPPLLGGSLARTEQSQPLATPDGPPGKFLEQLDEIGRAAVKSKAREHFGSLSGSFRLEARAWYVLGSA